VAIIHMCSVCSFCHVLFVRCYIFTHFCCIWMERVGISDWWYVVFLHRPGEICVYVCVSVCVLCVYHLFHKNGSFKLLICIACVYCFTNICFKPNMFVALCGIHLWAVPESSVVLKLWVAHLWSELIISA